MGMPRLTVLKIQVKFATIDDPMQPQIASIISLESSEDILVDRVPKFLNIKKSPIAKIS